MKRQVIITDANKSETEINYAPEIKAAANNAIISLLPTKSLEIDENTCINIV